MRPLVLLALAALLLFPGGADAAGLKLTSRDLASAEFRSPFIYRGFGCTGKNISPALTWSGAPAATKSFAVTVYDPDAPTGSGWWHWVIANIPASETSLAKNAGDLKADLAPKGSVQSHTDFGGSGYGGPCPPKGDKPHRYVFTVFAVDVATLGAAADATAAFIGLNLHAHAIAAASLVIYHGRP